MTGHIQLQIQKPCLSRRGNQAEGNSPVSRRLLARLLDIRSRTASLTKHLPSNQHTRLSESEEAERKEATGQAMCSVTFLNIPTAKLVDWQKPRVPFVRSDQRCAEMVWILAKSSETLVTADHMVLSEDSESMLHLYAVVVQKFAFHWI